MPILLRTGRFILLHTRDRSLITSIVRVQTKATMMYLQRIFWTEAFRDLFRYRNIELCKRVAASG